MIDDLAKLRKKQNEGLTAPQKFLLQLVCAGVYLFGMRRFEQITTNLYIPYLDITIDFGIAYYIIALLLLCGMMNSVNLTDGIDGLASSVTLIVGLFYGAAALFHGVLPAPGLTAVGAIMAGAAAGFLIYNFYPARVFMGDTGSLFFGGLVVGAAFMMDNPLIVVVDVYKRQTLGCDYDEVLEKTGKENRRYEVIANELSEEDAQKVR